LRRKKLTSVASTKVVLGASGIAMVVAKCFAIEDVGFVIVKR
jgi:hypothetical protein